MPLWAFTLLHYWRAIGEGRREYWIALAVDAGLLLLTSYLGILLLAILAGFTVANQRVRLVLASYEPWAAALAASLCLVPHLWWLRHSGLTLPSVLAGADGPVSIAGHILGGFRLFAGILHRPCRAPGAGRDRLRLAEDAPRPRTGDRAAAGETLRPAIRLCLCARPRRGGDGAHLHHRFAWTAHGNRAAGRAVGTGGDHPRRRRDRAGASAPFDLRLVRRAARFLRPWRSRRSWSCHGSAST